MTNLNTTVVSRVDVVSLLQGSKWAPGHSAPGGAGRGWVRVKIALRLDVGRQWKLHGGGSGEEGSHRRRSSDGVHVITNDPERDSL
jgi:hypothetical protein